MHLGITARYISAVMGMTPGDKAILMKATPHASGRSANALKSQSAWSHSICHLGDTDTYAVQRVSFAAANSVPDHTSIVELMGHELSWAQY